MAPTQVSDGQSTYYNGGGDGRIPGPEVAGWLGGALLVLAGGTWLVLWLIASRRQLESLDAADNAVLRTIAMNRLLRTVSTVAAGLAAIAGNFAARPDPAQGMTSWANPAGLACTVVLLVMWWWRPPRLAAAGLGVRNRPEPGTDAVRQHPAARLVSSLGALLGLAAAVPLAGGAFLYEALAVASYGFAGFVALMAASVLLVIAAGELLLQHNYGSPSAPRSWPRQPVSPALLTTAVLALLVFLLVLVLTAAGQARLGEGPDWVPVALLTAGVFAVSLPAVVTARRRRGIPDAPAGLDAALRAITIHRVVRTLAATLTAQAGVLLLTRSNAWAELLGRAAFGETDPAATSWWPAVAAGAVLGVAAAVIAVIPVRALPGRPRLLPCRGRKSPRDGRDLRGPGLGHTAVRTDQGAGRLADRPRSTGTGHPAAHGPEPRRGPRHRGRDRCAGLPGTRTGGADRDQAPQRHGGRGDVGEPRTRPVSRRRRASPGR